MSEKSSGFLYKYASPSNVEHIFSDDKNVTLKFSLPCDFNDPFELFLTIDFNRDPDELAFYLDLIGEGLQFPTTCFSKSPVVVPMWAHYAQNSQGFVIEFSEDKLRETFPHARFGDVAYSDVPTKDLSDLLMRAHQIMKFRYNLWLQSAVFSSAYFTKTVCWNYEQERRMVVDHNDTKALGDHTLLDVPRNAITAIICGPKARPETVAELKQIADEVGCKCFELRMGRSSAIPYMVDQRGHPFVYKDNQICEAEYSCEECLEPTQDGVNRCSWCNIDEDARFQASQRNSFRLLERLGLLDSYIKNSP